MSAAAPTSARPAPGGRARRALTVLAGLVVGVALGALVHAALPGALPVVLATLGAAGLVALLVVGLVDERRLARDLAADAPDAPAPRPPVLRGPPLAGAPAGAVGGLVLVWVAVQGDPVLAALLLVLSVPGSLLLQVLGRRALRQHLEAARAAHPDAGVVIAGFAEVGSTAWARWAKDAGVHVPSGPHFASLLVGDADGLEQRVSHDGALVHRWGWDEVALSRAPDPRRRDGALLLLTLHGPEPAARARAVPARRRRHGVTLRVTGGALTSTPAVVDAAIATLRARAGGPGAA